MKAFARTQPCENKRNILPQAQTVQACHFYRQVHYPHRISHVKEIEPSLICYCVGEYNKSTRFGDSHEIARGVRIRDGNRTPLLNLLRENGNDATAAADHIPKANRAKASCTIR